MRPCYLFFGLPQLRTTTDDLLLVHTAIHALGIIHSHSDSIHAFAPPRGVATRRFRRPIADLGHMKGWLHWRLLGALIKGDARAAYSRRVVAPSSSLRPLFFSARAPRLLSVVLRQSISSNQSLTHQPCPSAPVLRTGPPRPLIHHATVSPCSEKKTGLEVRDVRRCPFFWITLVKNRHRWCIASRGRWCPSGG